MVAINSDLTHAISFTYNCCIVNFQLTLFPWFLSLINVIKYIHFDLPFFQFVSLRLATLRVKGDTAIQLFFTTEAAQGITYRGKSPASCTEVVMTTSTNYIL